MWPGGNQVEHAGRSQVNVIRSSNSGLDDSRLTAVGKGRVPQCSHWLHSSSWRVVPRCDLAERTAFQVQCQVMWAVKGSADSPMGPRGASNACGNHRAGRFHAKAGALRRRGNPLTAARSAASGGPCFFVSRWRSSTQSASAPSVSLRSAALPIQSERGRSPASRADSS
jgi:hypothetical protein